MSVQAPFPMAYWGGRPSVGVHVQRDPLIGILSRDKVYDGIVNSKKWLFSAWFTANRETTMSVYTNTTTLSNPYQIVWSGGTPQNILSVFATSETPGFGAALSMQTSRIDPNTGWHHLVFSVDMAGASHMYIDDVSDKTINTYENEVLLFSRPHPIIGAAFGLDMVWDGCLAEVWSFPGVSMDLSVVANRRKFITGAGRPAKLGLNGQLPTGVSPIAYAKGPVGTNWTGKNFGTGGDYRLTGNPLACATKP